MEHHRKALKINEDRWKARPFQSGIPESGFIFVVRPLATCVGWNRATFTPVSLLGEASRVTRSALKREVLKVFIASMSGPSGTPRMASKREDLQGL